MATANAQKFILEDVYLPYSTRSLVANKQAADSWISPRAQNRIHMRANAFSFEDSVFERGIRRSEDRYDGKGKPYVVRRLKQSTFRWRTDRRRACGPIFGLMDVTPQSQSPPPLSLPEKPRPKHQSGRNSVKIPKIPPEMPPTVPLPSKEPLSSNSPPPQVPTLSLPPIYIPTIRYPRVPKFEDTAQTPSAWTPDLSER